MMEDAIRLEVKINYEAYQLAVKKIELSKIALSQSIENQRVVKNQFDNQLKLISDVLDADVMQLQSQINLINATSDAQLAYYKLMKSAGQ